MNDAPPTDVVKGGADGGGEADDAAGGDGQGAGGVSDAQVDGLEVPLAPSADAVATTE